MRLRFCNRTQSRCRTLSYSGGTKTNTVNIMHVQYHVVSNGRTTLSYKDRIQSVEVTLKALLPLQNANAFCASLKEIIFYSSNCNVWTNAIAGTSREHSSTYKSAV